MVYTTYFQDLQTLTNCKLVPQLKCSIDSQLEYYKQLLMTFNTVLFTIGVNAALGIMAQQYMWHLPSGLHTPAVISPMVFTRIRNPDTHMTDTLHKTMIFN